MDKLWRTHSLTEGFFSFNSEIKIMQDKYYMWILIKKVGSARNWSFLITDQILKDLKSNGIVEGIVFSPGLEVRNSKVLDSGTAEANMSIMKDSIIKNFKGMKTFKPTDVLSYRIIIDMKTGGSSATFKLNPEEDD